MLQKKSKEFLDSISRIKKIAHAQRKTKDFHPGMLMTMKIIFNDYLNQNYKYNTQENIYFNDIDNLIILCPVCHRKLSSHKYELIDRQKIVIIK